MDIDRTAPVVTDRDIEIAVEPERAWDLLADLQRWPKWNPDVKTVAMKGPLAEGTVFRWRAGPGTITSRLRRVDRPRLLAWTGRILGIRAVHVWRFEPRDGGTLATSAESWRGFLAQVFRERLQRQLDETNEKTLRTVKEQLEAPTET